MSIKAVFSDQYIVLTGGAGFVGSCVLRYLNDLGYDNIIVVDDFNRGEKWKNLIGKKYQDFISRHELMQFLKENRNSIGAIIHMGAITDTTEVDGPLFYRDNYRFSVDLARFALEHNLRFVYASSAATYGDCKTDCIDADESLDTLIPLNMYAQSKQMFDLWLVRQKALDKVVGLKFFNVYGPNEYHKGSMASMVFHLYHQIKEHKKARLFKSNNSSIVDGGQRRDFVYIKDVAAIVVDFLLTSACGIYNIGTGHARTFNDLAFNIFKVLGKKENIEYFPMPSKLSLNYQNFTQASLKKIQLLQDNENRSFSLKTSLDTGIRDYVLNYLEKGNAIW